MIGFLSPLFLLASAAVAVPIVLHLIRRREVRRVIFPAIRYLRRAEKRHARLLRIRHLLLLMTRVVMVLLLAVLAAGPLIGRGDADDHHATALAILLDDSQSSARLLADRRALDIYTERIRMTLDALGTDDRVALFSAVPSGSPLVIRGVDQIREFLHSPRPAAASADLPAAIRQAAAWLSSVADGRRREIQLLTDLQAVSIGGIEPVAGEGRAELNGLDATIVAYAVDAPETGNGAIGQPTPEATPITADLETRVGVPITWYGPDEPKELVVARLIAGGSVLAVSEARFGDAAVMRLPPRDSGWIQGHVEIDNHGLAADDRYYFTWFARPPARVTVRGDPGAFAAHALRALSAGGRLSLVDANPDVVVAADGEGLERAVRENRSALIIPPESALDLPRLNRRLSDARIPWRLEAIPSEAGGTRLAEAAPIEGLGGLRVQRHYRLVALAPGSRDSTLVALETGEPWLVRGQVGSATYLILSTPLVPEASSLPVSAAMLPTLDAMVGEWIRHTDVSGTQRSGGASVVLPPRSRLLRTPDGSTIAVEGGAPYTVREPGNYRALDADGKPELAFSVNAPEREADLSRANPSQLEAHFADADWRWVESQDPAAWRSAIFGARRGRLVWRPLVAALVLFAIVEASLAAAGRRRQRQTPRAAEGRERDRQAVEVP